ncbi:hypothetical protein JAAARDRAFT_43077 [Jaapia argillacea MUCL 33604]|uniref:Uncharacterized protein n=1 Tax=Jaapia argillacea MUCL 33604 TaxID=933084 RepID=A0A067PDP0_9AGAM|nr:hypothetical protein JAAARDRAFT_43077 [Jaapia argillacea MUCL 33604]
MTSSTRWPHQQGLILNPRNCCPTAILPSITADPNHILQDHPPQLSEINWSFVATTSILRFKYLPISTDYVCIHPIQILLQFYDWLTP